jgi:hypothetical protein
MAKWDTTFLLPKRRDQAFDEVRTLAGKQGWQITKTTPPGRYHRLIPELTLKADKEQLDGCGKTRIQFDHGGFERTRVRVYTAWALNKDRAETPAISLLNGLGLNPKDHGLSRETKRLPGRSERNLVRVLVAGVVIATIVACVLVHVPEDSEGNLDPPAVALNDPKLFRVEVALLVFYGGLLLLTPAFAGMFRGRLPTEISTKGAKYGEEVVERADENAALNQATVDEHTEQIGTLIAEMSLHKKAAESPPKAEVGK